MRGQTSEKVPATPAATAVCGIRASVFCIFWIHAYNIYLPTLGYTYDHTWHGSCIGYDCNSCFLELISFWVTLPRSLVEATMHGSHISISDLICDRFRTRWEDATIEAWLWKQHQSPIGWISVWHFLITGTTGWILSDGRSGLLQHGSRCLGLNLTMILYIKIFIWIYVY